MSVPPDPAFEQPPAAPSHPTQEVMSAVPAPVVQPPPASEIPPPVEQTPAVPEIHSQVEAPEFSNVSSAVESAPPVEPVFLPDPLPVTLREPAPDLELDLPVEAHPAVHSQPAARPLEAAPVFNLDSLPPEEQELHRRAFRVAKVSMQDIRMLRPEDVRLGRENKDLCSRLRDDIEKAHKEYDRRFQPIRSHPVDYFYDWMVEILGGGDPQALGEYPYRSPVPRR
jgi:hypothetical protein